MGLLDFLFPKKCVNCGRFGAYVCPNCFIYLSFDVKPICLVCNRQTYTSLTHEHCRGRYSIDGAFSSIVFGKIAKKLVYRFKYKPYLHDLGTFIIDLCYEGIIQNEVFFKIVTSDALLVPIPLHSLKYKQRGYNQADMLAKGLSKKFNLPTMIILQRIRATKSQVSLDRVKRKENIAGAFVLGGGREKELQGKTIFLVDDVLTSGATLAEAAKVLKKAGAKAVYGLTLAHGQ